MPGRESNPGPTELQTGTLTIEKVSNPSIRTLPKQQGVGGIWGLSLLSPSSRRHIIPRLLVLIYLVAAMMTKSAPWWLILLNTLWTTRLHLMPKVLWLKL